MDHIRPHRGDPVLFWDQTNWQPLCKHHHDVKTRNEDQHPVYHYEIFDIVKQNCTTAYEGSPQDDAMEKLLRARSKNR